MDGILSHSLPLLIPLVIVLHLYWSPYTKVEESFNIQAVHDIIISGIPSANITEHFATNYDHVHFPGSVPRTFVGAVLLAGLSRPWMIWLRSPTQLQSLARAILGLFNAITLISFKKAVDLTFGNTTGTWYILLQASQFHAMYYASRTLPNMFAFGLSTLALRSLMIANSPSATERNSRRHYRLCLYLLTVAGIIFRSELSILLAATTLHLLTQRRISFSQVIIPAGAAGAVIGLSSTVLIDSFFWQKFPLWPEWSAFYYNTIQGHASEWGVAPWWTYLFNHIPRLLLNPISITVLVPVAVLNPATRYRSLQLLLPQLLFVAVYSILPHKEWRFIIYVIPVITAIAAAGAAWIWDRRTKAHAYRLLSVCLMVSVAVSFAAALGIMAISSLNYPGGVALTRLHELTSDLQRPVIRVHLDNLACQTGVTRFLQKHSVPGPESLPLYAGQIQTVWLYDKTEDEEQLLSPTFWENFDFVLVEKPERAIGKWEIIDTVYGYGGIGIVRPGERLSSHPRATTAASTSGSGFKPTLEELWRRLAQFGRNYITHDWWVELRMVPKINILKRPSEEIGIEGEGGP